MKGSYSQSSILQQANNQNEQTLLIKRAVQLMVIPTYYNVSIVTPTLRMNHTLHNRPTINMKAIQCSTTQYSVRLLYILFCLAALIDSPPNCH